MTAGTTKFRAWKEPIKFKIGSAIPLGFVFELPEHLTPCGAGNRFGKAMILEHIGNRQPFDKYRLVFAYGLCRKLVQVILACVYYLCVNLCKFKTRLTAI